MIKATMKYTQQAEVIEAMKPLISTRGLFIRTRTTRPVGSEVHFEFTLADKSITYAGEGIVRKEIPFVGGPSSQRAGMLIALRKINRPFKEIVDAVIGAQQQSDRSITPSAMQKVPPEAINPENASPDAAPDAPETKRVEEVQSSESPKNSLIVDTKNSNDSLDLFGDLDMEEELDFLFSGINKQPTNIQPHESTFVATSTGTSALMKTSSNEDYDFSDTIDFGEAELNDIDVASFDDMTDIHAIAEDVAPTQDTVDASLTTETDLNVGDMDASRPFPTDETADTEDDQDSQTVTGMPKAFMGDTVSSDAISAPSDMPADTSEAEASVPTAEPSPETAPDALSFAEAQSLLDETHTETPEACTAHASENVSQETFLAPLSHTESPSEVFEALREQFLEEGDRLSQADAGEATETQDVQETESPSEVFEALREQFLEEGDRLSQADADEATETQDVQETESPSEVFEALREQFLEEGDRLSQADAGDATETQDDQQTESSSEAFDELRAQILDESIRLKQEMGYERPTEKDVVNEADQTAMPADESVPDTADSIRPTTEAEALFSSLQAEISQPKTSSSKSLIDNLVSGTPVTVDPQPSSTVSRPKSHLNEQPNTVESAHATSTKSTESAKVQKNSDDLDLSALVKSQENLLTNSTKPNPQQDTIDISKMPKLERKSLKTDVDDTNQKKGFFGRLFNK